MGVGLRSQKDPETPKGQPKREKNFILIQELMPIVYFDQRMGAPHAFVGQNLFFMLKQLFPSFSVNKCLKNAKNN